ncbi:uncharacterized protein MYCFIDRAFT_180538 [Pseudocercospora fijiensis CIRAD86]|uniref:Uncharacterized protein n=1 Tax=Pseudocercospora fijiensis (strain CIRAD86) TaxID=383855 RepID=M2YGF2_PSEFD|nr:uncharacterized protein MYCFIDRAFT_180538 [Pseudocercospora fijiensis CIRAD86]EME76875.1 hypothetical protein MYCFIDRAFT_180538 [Pseudocercospora fijiensis CIRAD86]
MKDQIKMQKLLHKAKEWRKRRKERRSASKSTSKRESSIRPQTKDSRLTTISTLTAEHATPIQISSNYHTQEQSTLFATLPGEIRVLIWSYALAPPDPKSEHREPRCYTSLLLSCRRIYSEASHLALEQAEPTFDLFYPDRDTANHQSMHLSAEKTVATLVALDGFLKRLTGENRKLIKGVRVRSNAGWLRERRFFNTFAVARGCWAKRLVVEILGDLGDLALEKGVGGQMLRQALDAGVRDLTLEVVGVGGKAQGGGLRSGLGIDEGEWELIGEENCVRRSEKGEKVSVERLRWKLA